MIKNFDEMVKSLGDHPKRRVAVAAGHDKAAIEALARAKKENTAEGVLVGEQNLIEKIAKDDGIDVSSLEIVNVVDSVEAAAQATKLVSEGQCDILMKGKIHTDDFLRALLNKDYGLRSEKKSLLSHAFIAYPKKMNRFVMITDAAMNISPDFEQKAGIAANAIGLASALGIESPKVAVLAAVELVNPKMQATQDAAILSLMSLRGQFDEGVVQGPFAFDNAVSEMAAQIKGIENPVAGKADVLLVPNIECGNILVKCFAYWGDGQLAGVLLGARKPVVLTSRADSSETKYLSVCSAVYLENFRRGQYKLGQVQ